MKSGGTQRDHLERAARSGGPRAERHRATLDAHPCPPVFAGLYRTFVGVNEWRGSGGFGPALLTLGDMEAYERRFLSAPLLPGELRLVKRLDFAALASAEKKAD